MTSQVHPQRVVGSHLRCGVLDLLFRILVNPLEPLRDSREPLVHLGHKLWQTGSPTKAQRAQKWSKFCIPAVSLSASISLTM
jgi:hypothetical protein